MFLNGNSSILPELNDVCSEIEKSAPSKTVIAAKNYLYYIQVIPSKITVASPRKFNVLEEFILRAAYEYAPPISEDFLASLLGLNVDFVERVADVLRRLNVLEVNADRILKLTSNGRKHFENQQVPGLPKIYNAFLYFDAVTQKLRFIDEVFPGVDDTKSPKLSNIAEFKNRKVDFFCLELNSLRTALRESDLHNLSDNIDYIIDIDISRTESKLAPRILGIYAIFDALEKKIILEARDNKGAILSEASHSLNELLSSANVAMPKLCDSTEDEIYIQCQMLIDQQDRQIEERIRSLQVQTRDNSPSIRQVRGRDIAVEFDNVILSADFQIIIFSPWISRGVVDDNFLCNLQAFVNRGGWVLIGYGIAVSEEKEDRRVDPRILSKFKSIKTDTGVEAVQVHWLGRSHAKELIVDQGIHMLGSNNLLSFRSSSGLWDESVYIVSDHSQVSTAYQYYSERFQKKAADLWAKAIKTGSRELARSAVCIWGCMNMEDRALSHIESEGWNELLDYWYKVTSQSMKTNRIPKNSVSYSRYVSFQN